MEKLFFGNPVIHKVEEKCRVSIPAKFREMLDTNYIYTNYVEKFLIRCYPEKVYERRKKEMLKKPENDRGRQIFFSAQKSQIDNEGRILLKGSMRGLEKVIFAANGDVFDIWGPKKFPYKHQIDYNKL